MDTVKTNSNQIERLSSETPADSVTDILSDILRKHLKFAKPAKKFPMDEELESLGLDSMSAIDMLLALEEAFGIVFPDEMLTPEVFRTGRSLEEAVSLLKRMQEQ